MYMYQPNRINTLKRSVIISILCCTVLMFATYGEAQQKNVPAGQMQPGINPPRIGVPGYTYSPPKDKKDTLHETPTTEWGYHKSSDNAHPDGNEQQMMWLMNRARTNPTQEGIWLAETDISNIASARSYFGVDINLLKSEFAGYNVKPPAAFDVRLYNAAKAHSDYLISIDGQNHDGQFSRVTDAGFSYAEARGNVFSYSDDGAYAHAGFNIDWGSGTGGMQDGHGHRMAIMSIDGDYTNVGVAMVPGNNPATQVGPLVTTGNYCKASTTAANHYNRFIVGTVWDDSNRNGMYDPGEGVGGVTVTPDAGTYYAVTANSGGYAIPIESSGTYNVTFSGAVNGTTSITLGSESAQLDFEVHTTSSSSQRTK